MTRPERSEVGRGYGLLQRHPVHEQDTDPPSRRPRDIVVATALAGNVLARVGSGGQDVLRLASTAE